MMNSDRDQNEATNSAKPIIIVRRRPSGHGDGHHGGAWKIAYADFMTAMMAFFLVMWLVNSTDEKKIVQVAAYFNPMRLSEKVPSERGLQDGTLSTRDVRGSGAPAPGSVKAKADDAGAVAALTKPESKRETKKKAEREQQLLADPGPLLDEIAAAAAPASEGSPTVALPSGRHMAAVLDPFSRAAVSTGNGRASGEHAPQTAPDSARARPSPPTETWPPSPGAQAEIQAGKMRAHASEIEAAVRAALARRPSPGPLIDVRATAEGILLSVSDHATFGMFAVGSAEPLPELVLVIEGIAEVLSAQSGRLVIRGHTDNRTYKSKTYDNWRLSSSRAHMAHYMLMRGGIEPRRIERIEGHADQLLRNGQDGAAAENRRIEILLKVGTT